MRDLPTTYPGGNRRSVRGLKWFLNPPGVIPIPLLAPPSLLSSMSSELDSLITAGHDM